MKFPPATPLKPLDLTPASRAGGMLRPLAASDLARTARHTTAPQSQHDQIVEQTRKWVGQTFFGTLLKQMSESPFKSDLFSGGRGGEAFSSMHHQHLAERMASGAGARLVNSIVRRIEGTQKGSGFGVQGSEKTEDRHPDAKNMYRSTRQRTSKHGNLNLVS